MIALKVTEHTLVGVMSDKFPISRGNCFSVLANDQKNYKVVNMNLENLEFLIKEDNRVSWPIEIKLLGNGYCKIIDKRIPKNYLDKDYCIICTSRNLLPFVQRINMWINDIIYILNGTRKYSTAILDDGTKLKMMSQTIKGKPKMLNSKWQVEDGSIFFGDYIPITTTWSSENLILLSQEDKDNIELNKLIVAVEKEIKTGE